MHNILLIFIPHIFYFFINAKNINFHLKYPITLKINIFLTYIFQYEKIKKKLMKFKKKIFAIIKCLLFAHPT